MDTPPCATAASTPAPSSEAGSSRPADADLLRFLSASDRPLTPADAIIGFGHFDLRVPRLCVSLWRGGIAPRVVFTGGFGAGTADLGQAEALAFAEEARRSCPGLHSDTLILESSSTNTAENIRFTLEALAESHPPVLPGRLLRSVILVATPARLRRVRLTWQLLQPEIPCLATCPVTDLRTESSLYASKNQALRDTLTGELERLRTYPARGWIRAQPIPWDSPQVGAAATKAQR